MKEIIINKNQSGQRFDKFLHKLLPEAGTGFLYKMLRKKNITLNLKKAEGKEILCEGDCIRLFLSEETIEKFSNKVHNNYEIAFQTLKKISIIYEDEHIVICNKPVGILSQKAVDTDLSLNEWLIGYLLQKNDITIEDLQTFKPSICNRLDRNTSGLVLCGKSLLGSQNLSQLIKSRSIHKYYRTIVYGQIKNNCLIKGFLTKDKNQNIVTILNSNVEGSSYIETAYKVLNSSSQFSLLEVELITGKTHQIRAHLASIGHPIIGDKKYGNQLDNHNFYHLSHQLLHAYRIEMPEISGELSYLSNKTFIANLPKEFEQILYKCL